MTDAFTAAVVGAIVGGVVGGGIGLIGVFYAAARSEQTLRRLADEQNHRLAAQALMLVRVEFEHNRTMLQQVWDRVTQQVYGLPQEALFVERMRFAEESLPTWAHNTWDTQAVQLPTVLKPETIRRLTELYSLLDSLSSYHTKLRDLESPHLFYNYHYWEQTVPQPPLEDVTATWSAMLKFLEDTLEPWTRCRKAVTTMLESAQSLTLEPELQLNTTGSPTSLPARIIAWFSRQLRGITPGNQRIEPRNPTVP